MKLIQQLYENETGERATYRKGSSDYHTLRYVNWLEDLLTYRKSMAQQKDAADLCTCNEQGCNCSFKGTMRNLCMFKHDG